MMTLVLLFVKLIQPSAKKKCQSSPKNHGSLVIWPPVASVCFIFKVVEENYACLGYTEIM